MGRRERRSTARHADAPSRAAESVDEFVSGLEEHEKVLVQIKEDLYAGSWERLEGDLQARLEGRPYLFKVKTGRVLQRDLEAIRRMREFEKKAGCDLAKALKEREGTA